MKMGGASDRASFFRAAGALAALASLSLLVGCQGVSSGGSGQGPGSGTTPPDIELTVTPTTIAAGDVVDGMSGIASGTLSAAGGNVTVTAASTNSSVFTISGLSLPVTIPAGKSVPFTVTF